MTRTRVGAVAAALAMTTMVVGCATAKTPPVAATVCTDTQSGAGIVVALTSSPCPVVGGMTGSAQISVKDSSGTPIKDATVKVKYDMSSMSMHGSVDAAASGEGYQARLLLSMGGTWDVTVEVTRGSAAPTDVHFSVTAK